MNIVAFRGELFHTLRAALLASAPREGAAILLAGQATSRRQTRLLIREIAIIGEKERDMQTETRFVISAQTLAAFMQRARQENLSLVFAHSHPFDRRPHFSAVDDAGEAEFMPAVFRRASDRAHASLVLGLEGFDGRVLKTHQDKSPVDRIDEIGLFLRRFQREPHSEHLREVLNEGPFDRNIRAFGAEGQRTLAEMRVAVVGLGGTGSVVAEQLAHLGVGSLTLIDPETIELTNTNRVIGSAGNIGRSKVESAAELVRRIRPNISVTVIKGVVHVAPVARPVLDSDLIFCCTDSQGSRAVLNQIAYQYLVPVIDVGIRIDAKNALVERITGRVQMLSPGLPCLVCQNFLDAEEVRRDLLSENERKRDPYIVGAVEPQPAVISLNATVSSLAVTMMLSAVTGIPVQTRHQVYLAEQGVVRAVEGMPEPDCIVCSLNGALARGDSWQLPWRLT